MRRILIWVALCAFYLSGIAQVKYDFQSTRSFKLKVNGHWVNVIPCQRLVFEWKTAEKKSQVVTYFSEFDSLSQSIIVKNGMEQAFQMQKVKEQNKWVLSGESPWTPSPEEEASMPSLDNVYSGDRHCQDPMSKDQFEQFVQSVSASPLTHQKLKTISFLAEGICCTVEQCVQVMNLFELEDDKLEALRTLAPRVFDWDNKIQLTQVFFTERAQVKAQAIVSQP